MNDREIMAESAQRNDTVAPAALARAVAFFYTLASEPLSTASVARIAGVTPNVLQQQFRTHFGTSPMQYLRQLRLEGVRAELLASNTTTHVPEIVRRWGYVHLGRFTDAYAECFNERPESTPRARTPLLASSTTPN